MSAQDVKGRGRNAQATEVLRRLDEIGAIKLEVLVSKSSEISGIAGVGFEDDGWQICYPNYIRIGPRGDIDIVSVATQLRQLGFDLKRVNTQTKG